MKLDELKVVEIYTDGACSGNPGPGGYCALLMYNDKRKYIVGGSKHTTNNAMELTAVVEGIKALRYPCRVKIYSDSAYVVNSINNKWLFSWIKNNWKTSSNQPVQNKQLWGELYYLMSAHKLEFIKVKGHAGNHYNEECDKLARTQMLVIKNESAS